MALRFISALCLLLSMPLGAMAQDQADPSAEMQKHFAEAYNHGDVVPWSQHSLKRPLE